MKVSICRSHNDIITTELQADNIKAILSGLKMQFGTELTDSLLHENYKYVLMNEAEPENAIALDAAVVGSTLEGFDTLFIVRDIDGNGQAIVAAIPLLAGTVAGAVVATIINIAISIAIAAIMQALSPTPEFSSDPAEAQTKKSALFNGAPIIREQGGIVPLILGAPYCGGVLISSGVYSEDV